jgi:hypothetical protein
MMTFEIDRQSFYKKPMREKMISFTDRVDALYRSADILPRMIREANSTEEARLRAIWFQDEGPITDGQYVKWDFMT